MPLILAIEPDRRQASQLAALVRIRLDAELLVADSIKRAVSMLSTRLPDLILISPMLSASDSAALAARLDRFDCGARHVRMMRIPALARQTGSSSPTPSRRRRTGAKSPGCDPSIFAAQVSDQLERATAERALHRAAAESCDRSPVEAARVAEPAEESPTANDEVVAAPDDNEVAAVQSVEEVEVVGTLGVADVVEVVEDVAVVEEEEEEEAPPIRIEPAPAVEATELWAALSANDSRVWPRIEGICIRTPALLAAFHRLEVWSALTPGFGAWPLIEGLPAHETAREAAADEHERLVRLVVDLRRELAALRLLHAEPAARVPATAAGPLNDWTVYGPDQFSLPALLARIDPARDLPDVRPPSDRPS